MSLNKNNKQFNTTNREVKQMDRKVIMSSHKMDDGSKRLIVQADNIRSLIKCDWDCIREETRKIGYKAYIKTKFMGAECVIFIRRDDGYNMGENTLNVSINIGKMNYPKGSNFSFGTWIEDIVATDTFVNIGGFIIRYY